DNDGGRCARPATGAPWAASRAGGAAASDTTAASGRDDAAWRPRHASTPARAAASITYGSARRTGSQPGVLQPVRVRAEDDERVRRARVQQRGDLLHVATVCEE